MHESGHQAPQSRAGLAQLLEKSRCLGTAVPNSSFRTLLPGKVRIMVADGESEESLVAALRGELH